MTSFCVVAAQIFAQPLEVSTTTISLLRAFPLSMAIAIVYKTVKLEKFSWASFIREVVLLFGTIVGFLALVAIGLFVIAYLARL